RLGPAPVPGAVSVAGISVLVVDDEADARELVAQVLEQEGVKVWKASSADEALRAVTELRPDVIVSDIAMPGEDGYALIGRVRSLERQHGGATPAVALTARARAEDRDLALAAGFDTHVPKPVEPSELLTILANLAQVVEARAR